MLRFFQKKQSDSINSSIINAFIKAFPENVNADFMEVIMKLPLQTYSNVKIATTESSVKYFLNNKEIEFPYRIYIIDDIEKTINTFTDKQKMIIHCIYSRSCDGYIRETHIRELLSMDYPDWCIPFIFKVCDEYVFEIIETIFSILEHKANDRFKQFSMENRVEFCKSYNRMISYWDEFYRDRCKKFKDYTGRKLFIQCFGYTRSMERKITEKIIACDIISDS